VLIVVPDAELLSLMQQSGVNFVGTVQRLGESTVADLPVDERTAVVRVSDVLNVPPALEGLAGMEVTVQLRSDAEPPAPGNRAVFFTDPIAFDKGIALREVDRRPAEDAQGAVLEATLAPGPNTAFFAQQLAEQRLRAHAVEADAVVEATVVGLERVGSAPMREHEPDYWRATMAVSHVEKGDVTGDRIQVLYINSLDVQHRLSPKPKASQEGLWLLHTTEEPLRDLAPWIIPDPEDFQPVENLRLLRTDGSVS
jgi:hypothetical protein